MPFSPPQTLQPTTGGHWQSQGIQRTNQQLLRTLIILSFWMFSPFQHKPAQCKMRNKGEMTATHGHHLNFLGPDPPSLLPSSLPLPPQAAGPTPTLPGCIFASPPADSGCCGTQTPPHWCPRPFFLQQPSFGQLFGRSLDAESGFKRLITTLKPAPKLQPGEAKA